MDWQIRLALILAGLILVGYIYFDFNKKKKRQVENEKLKDKYRNLGNQTDGEGLDLTGVGTARPAQDSDEPGNSSIIGNTIDEFITNRISTKDESNIGERRSEAESAAEIQRSSDQDARSSMHSNDSIVEKNSRKTSQKKNTQNQDLFENEVDQTSQIAKDPALVLSLLLQANGEHQYLGKDLLPLFLSQGLRHGEMDIFHRHLKIKGEPSNLLFSLANGIAPGTFDLKTMDGFKTPVLALFMALPGPKDPQIAYDAMYKTVKLLNKELGGEIYGESHCKYTQQTHNHRLDQIQEFIRGSLAN